MLKKSFKPGYLNSEENQSSLAGPNVLSSHPLQCAQLWQKSCIRCTNVQLLTPFMECWRNWWGTNLLFSSNFVTMWNFDMTQHIFLFFLNLRHGLIFCFFSSFQDQTESEEMTEQFERFSIAQSAGLFYHNQRILDSVILFCMFRTMFNTTHLKRTCEYITTWLFNRCDSKKSNTPWFRYLCQYLKPISIFLNECIKEKVYNIWKCTHYIFSCLLLCQIRDSSQCKDKLISHLVSKTWFFSKAPT